MGTHTDFTGAIRITPCVSEPLATKLQEFMDIRHMRRNVEQLHMLFPDPEERNCRCLAMEILVRKEPSFCQGKQRTFSHIPQRVDPIRRRSMSKTA